MRECFVVDIDGVILDTAFIFDEIFEKKLKGDEMWDYFHANCNGDRVKVIESSRLFLNRLFTLRFSVGTEIILLTSRNSKAREATIEKLKKEKIYFDTLIMREDGDYREPHVLKKEVLKWLQEEMEYEIIMFVDDELKNCEAAKELGILSVRKV